MNILVTGLAGLLGANLAFFLRSKHRVFGVDRNLVEIKDVVGIVGSVMDIEKIEGIIVKEKIEVIFHCAALVNVDECERRPDYAELINYQMTKNLSVLCAKYDVKLVFISTDAVFPGNKEGLYKEDDEVGPISVYGCTKLMAEKEVLKMPGNLVIRTNMYGFNYRKKNSFGEWVIQALQSDEPLYMFYDLKFSPILVNHLVELLEKCLEKNLSGVYNICCTGSISKYDLGCAIQHVFQLPGKINKVSMHTFKFDAPRTENMGMDNKCICEALGVKINTPEEDVREFFELWQNGYGQRLKRGK